MAWREIKVAALIRGQRNKNTLGLRWIMDKQEKLSSKRWKDLEKIFSE
jgi:hypothetical protein